MSELKEASVRYFCSLPDGEDDENERSLIEAHQKGALWLLEQATDHAHNRPDWAEYPAIDLIKYLNKLCGKATNDS